MMVKPGRGPAGGRAMPRRKDHDEEKLYALGAGYLAGEGLKQRDIAHRLGTSQPEVSRLLQVAEKAGWLERRPPLFHGAQLDPALWAEAQARFFSSGALLEKLAEHEREVRGALVGVTVFHGGDEEPFSRAAAVALEELLRRAAVVGVSWGRTLRRMVDALRQHAVPHTLREGRIELVPLCGEPLQARQDPLTFSSTALAAELSELLNGPGGPPPPSLAGVPAFIPSCFHRKPEQEVILRFLSLVAGYGAVFSGKDARVHRIDSVLTSLGVVHAAHRGIFLQERIDLGEISEEELDRLAIGDMGGIIIPNRGLSPTEQKRVRELNERWTGIKEEQVRTCARRAIANGRPGVIVLGVGAERRDLVKRIIALGLVNHLLIDRRLADALEAD